MTGAEVMVPEQRRVALKMGKLMGVRINNGVAPASEKTAEAMATGSDSQRRLSYNMRESLPSQA